MRSISPALALKVRELQQTAGNDANPRLSVVIGRHKVPVVDDGMLQTAVVGGMEVTRAAVAARRPDPNLPVDRIFIAAVDGTTATVYSGAFDGYRPPAAWAPELTIADAVDVAIAIEGRYIQGSRRVEYYTIGEPWVFWITAAGVLRGKRITDAGAGAELATDAVALSALMGPGNIGVLTVSDGIVLAWCTASGAVLTRQYFDGVWETAVLHSGMPAGAVDIALAKTWDYRLSVTLQTADGKVWLINGNSQISGNANNAYLDVSCMDLTAAVYETIPHDTAAAERLEVNSMELGADVYSTIAPTLFTVANIDDGTGNWGTRLRLVYSGPVYGLAGSASAFALAGGFTGEALAYDPADPDGKTLLLTMADFNNADPENTLTYTPGTLSTGPEVTALPGHSLAVTLTGLVPSAPPAVLSIVAVNNTTIDIQFDAALSSADIAANAAAFAVTGNEPAYSPGGALVPTTYAVSSVGWKPDSTDTVRLTLTTTGRLKHPQGNVTVAYAAASGNLKNAAGTLAVSSFSQGFDPDEAALALFFNPHDAENIQVGLDLTADVYEVIYNSTKSSDENIQASLDLNVAVYDTNNNPV